MAMLIENSTKIKAAGKIPKMIEEFIGLVNSNTKNISIAIMNSPQGWEEPGQCPEFEEFSLVLDGTLQAETKNGTIMVNAGQVLHTFKNEWVKYSTPGIKGARYVSVCVPAFSPEIVHRDK